MVLARVRRGHKPGRTPVAILAWCFSRLYPLSKSKIAEAMGHSHSKLSFYLYGDTPVTLDWLYGFIRLLNSRGITEYEGQKITPELFIAQPDLIVNEP